MNILNSLNYFATMSLRCLLAFVAVFAGVALAQDSGSDTVFYGSGLPQEILDSILADNGDDDITVTRWIGLDGSLPITYEDWKSQVGGMGPFGVQFIAQHDAGDGASGQPEGFCILINAALYPELEFQIERYMTELTGEGYAVGLYALSGGTPDDLRTFLQDRYLSGMEGCVLIGDLPVPWYEIGGVNDPSHEYEQFPCDLYYMDLDGEFSDTDGDGLYDLHTGSVAPDVWVGRLTAHPLDYEGVDEVSLLRNYFEKNHLYRSELRPLANRGLMYVDDDWDGSAGLWGEHMREAYNEINIIKDRWTTWDTDYEDRLSDNYEFIHVCAHSTAFGHVFYRPPYSSSETGFSEVVPIDPQAYFYNLFACSNARYVENNYMAGWYIFCKTYGLGAVGSTKTGGMRRLRDFYIPLGKGNSIGQAFLDWFAARAIDGFSSSEIFWYYGMTLIGDPTLTIGYPYKDSTLQYDNGTIVEGMVIPNYYDWELPNVRYTAPETCTLKAITGELWCVGTPTIRLYVWESDGLFPTNAVDSMDIPYDVFSTQRIDLSALNLVFEEGEEFHIGFTIVNRLDDEYIVILAGEPTATDIEDRSTLFHNGNWHTLYDIWDQELHLMMRAIVVREDPLRIIPTALSEGEVGTPYLKLLEATSGVPPYDWDLAAGELPDGIDLSPTTGELSGIPTIAGTGTYVFTVRVTDSDNPPYTDIQHLQLSIPYCVDADSDGFGDPEHPENTCPTDNCPSVYNPEQKDCDGDGIGDSCEVIRSWYVQSDGTGDAPTIQAAIDSCTHGDTVLVADGVYAGPGNQDIDFKGRRILLKSELGPGHTIIDCQCSPGQHRRAFSLGNNEDSSCIIEGFTVRGGYGPDFNSAASGGGMLLDGASPTVRNCIFADNSAALGGAVYVFQAAPRFENCTFVGNTATYGAAVFGMDHSTVRLENCIIAFNEQGHPVSCLEVSNATLSYCDVYGNTGGDWVGCLAGQVFTNGNFSKDPLFCENSGDYAIDAVSPCAPDNNYCDALIGAVGVECSDWRIVCDASILHGVQLLSSSGTAKTAPGPGGWDIEVVPDYFQIHLTFCQPVDFNIGDAAEVYVDFNQDNIFDDNELCAAFVSRTDRNPARDITIRVDLDEDLDLESARVAIYSAGECKLIGESGQLIDYLDLNPSISGVGNYESLAAGGMTPLEFALGHSHPNPFNSTTVIPYSIPDAGWVKLEIYDILGRRVKTLVNETRAAGQYETKWDGTNSYGHPVPSGLYFYRLAMKGFAETKKMVFMK